MEIEVKIDDSLTCPKIIILTNKMTAEIKQLIEKLSSADPQVLCGFQGETLAILDQNTIIRIYTASGKVYATTESGEYLLRLRLYESENRLDKNSFVRISNSEIVNLKKVLSFDLSFAGTICVSLSDGTSSYVSRRYVNKIKKILGI